MYLNIENLVKFYSKEDPLIKDLNFSVQKGEFVSFIGESGSGKTTFLKCLAGLEKINSGKITLNNRVLDNKTTFIKPNHRKIGFIFQDYPLFPHLSVLENQKINLEKQYEKNIEYYVELTGLGNLLNRYPHELSGGEQQRVCITRALIREPDLLLMDEPSMGLAPALVQQNFELIQQIHEEGMAIFMVEQNANMALSIADRGWVLQTGRVVLDDTAEALLANPELRSSYLGES